MSFQKKHCRDSIEILLAKCGLNHDVIDEIRGWLPKCKHCGHGRIIAPLFKMVVWYRRHRECVEFVSVKYAQANPEYIDRNKYKFVYIYPVCMIYTVQRMSLILHINYNITTYKHNLDDKIIKFALHDRRLHHALIEIFRSECNDKLWLYYARYKHLSGASNSRRSYWGITDKYLRKKYLRNDNYILK